jgi:hypothetical protein
MKNFFQLFIWIFFLLSFSFTFDLSPNAFADSKLNPSLVPTIGMINCGASDESRTPTTDEDPSSKRKPVPPSLDSDSGFMVQNETNQCFLISVINANYPRLERHLKDKAKEKGKDESEVSAQDIYLYMVKCLINKLGQGKVINYILYAPGATEEMKALIYECKNTTVKSITNDGLDEKFEEKKVSGSAFARFFNSLLISYKKLVEKFVQALANNHVAIVYLSNDDESKIHAVALLEITENEDGTVTYRVFNSGTGKEETFTTDDKGKIDPDKTEPKDGQAGTTFSKISAGSTSY